MLSLPLLLLSLHALAVYSAPALNINDIVVPRQAGGTIHGLTLRREEYHQLQKRVRNNVKICNVPARTNYRCTKRYPSTLTKRSGTGSSRTNVAKPPGFYNEEGGSSPSSEDPSEYSGHRDSSEERQDLQDDKDMEEYEKQGQVGGNQCDHLVELQTVGAILNQYCQGTPGISTVIAKQIRDDLNNSNKNLYLVKGDVNGAKRAAIGRALLRAKDLVRRPLTYKSDFDKPTWIGVVEYLEAKESVARTNAAGIKTTSGLTANVDTQIHEIYKDALAVAQAMSRL